MKLRLRNWFSVVLSVLVLALAVGVSPVAATNHPTTHWVLYPDGNPQGDASNWYQVDDRCDNLSNPPFRISLYEDNNFGGARFDICGYFDNLGAYGRWCCGSWLDWNDTLSSAKFVFVPSNADIQLFENIDMGGQHMTVFNEGWLPSMPSGWNDRISSIRKIIP